MIDRQHSLSVRKQAATLGISRGSVYYLLPLVRAADLALMLRIDILHLDYPFAGSRMMRDFLVREGFDVGRLHARGRRSADGESITAPSGCALSFEILKRISNSNACFRWAIMLSVPGGPQT